MAIANFTGLELLGQTICFRDLRLESLLPESVSLDSFSGVVVAIQIPAPNSGIETALLIRDGDTFSEDYVDLEDIQILSISN
jgi:hypothetical protein